MTAVLFGMVAGVGSCAMVRGIVRAKFGTCITGLVLTMIGIVGTYAAILAQQLP